MLNYEEKLLKKVLSRTVKIIKGFTLKSPSFAFLKRVFYRSIIPSDGFFFRAYTHKKNL